MRVFNRVYVSPLCCKCKVEKKYYGASYCEKCRYKISMVSNEKRKQRMKEKG